MTKKLIVLLWALALCTSTLYARTTDVIVVKGTHLAKLGNAHEVLLQVSRIVVVDGSLTVVGCGKPWVFVDGRKIENQADLFRIPAESISTVEIITEVGAEYDGKTEAVIIIHLIEHAVNELKLNETAEMYVSPSIGGSNDIQLSGRKNRFLYDVGLVASSVKTKEFEKSQSDSFILPKHDLKERSIDDYTDSYRTSNLATMAQLGWLFNDNHRVSLRYQYEYVDDLDENEDYTTSYFKRHGGNINFENPDSVVNVDFNSKTKINKNFISIGYSGNIKDWKLGMNSDSYLHSEDGNSTEYHRITDSTQLNSLSTTKYDLKYTYFKMYASHKLWKGDLTFGVTVENEFLNVFSDDKQVEGDKEHVDVFGLFPTCFATTSQQFGKLKLDLGFRYQLEYYQYKPLSDDETRPQIIQHIGSDVIYLDDHFFEPDITASIPFDEFRLTAGFMASHKNPTYTDATINMDNMQHHDYETAFVNNERHYKSVIKGNWKWAELKGWHTFYTKPIFADVNDDKFNGPDYHSMDWLLTVTPSLSLWNFDISLMFHKQWLDMATSDGLERRLNDPMLTIRCTNVFELPCGVNLMVAGLFSTRGSDQNIYCYNPTWKLDVTVEKSFLNDRLSLLLTADNVADHYYEDVIYYTPEKDETCDGYSRQKVRIFTLSVKYHI